MQTLTYETKAHASSPSPSPQLSIFRHQHSPSITLIMPTHPTLLFISLQLPSLLSYSSYQPLMSLLLRYQHYSIFFSLDRDHVGITKTITKSVITSHKNYKLFHKSLEL